jgi:hypothetical protein
LDDVENIDKVVKILRRIPPKSLRIIELANEIPIIDGQFDVTVLRDKKLEIRQAVDEAAAYGRATLNAVNNLVDVKAVD